MTGRGHCQFGDGFVENEEKRNQPSERQIQTKDRVKVNQMDRKIRSIIVCTNETKGRQDSRKRNTSHFLASLNGTILFLRG